ncbi:MAG: hypothetical protein C3F15_14315 [Holophagae bacterium]|nr:MAG: hypothetical protein C3F15_14315 [Holophagae bacterium]
MLTIALVAAAGTAATAPPEAKPTDKLLTTERVGPASDVTDEEVGASNWPLDMGGGEDCSSARVISSLPYVDSGSTSSAFNDYDESCPYTGGSAPDVVYSYSPPANQSVKISLCDPGTNTDYDTKLYVYQNVCPGTVVGCSDDDCSSPITSYVSELTATLFAGNTYYIVVDGYASAFGNYTLAVEEFAPQTCPCPPDADLFEASLDPLCGNDIGGDPNGGCNTDEGNPAPYITQISCNTTICGTTSTFTSGSEDLRDTDWYEVDLAQADTIRVTLTSTANVYLFDLTDEYNCPAVGIAQTYTEPGSCAGSGEMVISGVAGPNWIWVGPTDFGASAGVTCPTEYTMTVTCDGQGSCTYSISPPSANFGEGGGTGSVSVSTTAGCPWTAFSNNSWIHVTGGSSGNGSGTVSYSVDANSGSARTGTMTIAGRTFTVTQAGGGGGGAYTYQVAGIAHAGGAGGSVWRSTLCVTNRSGAVANLTLVYRMASNTVTRTYTLQNNWITEWEDVAASLFNQGASTSGSIEISSDVPLMVVARTYNEAPDGTFGQGMPGNPDSEALTYGQIGVLPQLKKTSVFRTNVGLMNHGSAACNVRIRLYSETGNQLGNTIDTSVPAKEWKQINDVFGEAGVGQCPIGYATVEVRTAGGMIWAYGSVVDNGTGDPTTILLFIE